jgi:CRISPR-associated protein (TIGR02710 family)
MPAILLICTVGGAPEAIVASVLACEPARVIFVCSPDSQRSLHAQAGAPGKPGVLDLLASHGRPYDAGRMEVVEVPSAQDLERCVEAIHRRVTPEVEGWLARGAEHAITVDFTGGTKCMTLALGLMMRSWPCRLQYVGGAERTKEGLGIVVSGREQTVHFQDPWNSLGYQLLDDLRVIFDSGNCAAAAALAAEARNRISAGPLKGAVAALVHFLEGYAGWDRFDHGSAVRSLELFGAQRNLLVQLISMRRIEALAGEAGGACRFLRELEACPKPSRGFVIDLLANAQRRLAEGRYDDAVARIYRAIEAIAQWRLAEDHGVTSTAEVPLESVPEPLRAGWLQRAENGVLRLALQDAYCLLEALGDPAGVRFRSSGLAASGHSPSRSPLAARNASYLAHGFQPASAATAERLLHEALGLLGAAPADLPRFPKLRDLLGSQGAGR